MAKWADRAEAARADHPHQRIAYGPGPREVMDLFTPEGQPEAPVAVFLHGGYWQALDGAAFHGIAPALLSHGIAVALPTYDLAPTVSLGRILRQVRTATELIRDRTGYRPLVFGHSAGGHMAAALLSEGRAGAAVAISGVFDLLPLTRTSLNEALQLDPLMATALSPIHWPVPDGSSPGGTTLDCWVGADESAEFRRQSRAMAGRWGAAGADASVRELAGLNHFTVLDPLFDPGSPEVARLVQLARDAAGETSREAAPA
ncbi:alpha/beta hydrolase [Brevundimonas sp. A19_0]|uniref:alpha/beta hydrolase n=1 Tax=Brevundimonas sp. A19_0 TaxID=2821087 RepID=UPI001AD95579|nr:alpha/beta hydrolase [Brevundimonas sp. A19_0]MBO9502000.1 alpha/beta hydrolase [Brevundimonas sp. A19_0]